MAAGAHFGCLKFTFDRMSGHFRSICNFCCKFFDKMTAVGHLGCPRLTFDHISGHLRSIRNLFLFEIVYKMAAGGHFGSPKITFDNIFAISDQYKKQNKIVIFLQNNLRRSFWMSEIHL